MLIAIAAGVALGFLYSLSPMSVWFVVLGAALVRLAMRGLSPREARWVAGLLITAMAIRAVIVAALFLFGSPDRIYVPFNVFFGDEQYMIVRALRQRAVWLDLPMRVEQFSDAFEIYGRTSYLQVIAASICSTSCCTSAAASSSIASSAPRSAVLPRSERWRSCCSSPA